MDYGLHITDIISRHVISAILHMAHCQGKISDTHGMSLADFVAVNYKFIDAFGHAFHRKHKFVIQKYMVKAGIEDFIERMVFLHTH